MSTSTWAHTGAQPSQPSLSGQGLARIPAFLLPSLFLLATDIGIQNGGLGDPPSHHRFALPTVSWGFSRGPSLRLGEPRDPPGGSPACLIAPSPASSPHKPEAAETVLWRVRVGRHHRHVCPATHTHSSVASWGKASQYPQDPESPQKTYPTRPSPPPPWSPQSLGLKGEELPVLAWGKVQPGLIR